MIWAIVPVKPLRESKSRLSGVLTPDERAELTSFLLQRTLRILHQVSAIDQVMVVSRDPAVLKIARQSGAMTLVEGSRPGLNVALLRAAYVAAAQRATSLLILPSDLPLLTTADIEMMLTGATPANGLRPGNGHYPDPSASRLNGHSNGYSNGNGHSNGMGHVNGHHGPQNSVPLPDYAKAMTICPDHHEDGTNALFIRPATDFNFHYGLGSFHQHIKEAERLEMFYRVVHAPGIKFDLDTESDWTTYRTVFHQERSLKSGLQPPV
jgi:2-phospho-L-lactate guanylyltransferase